MSIIKIFGALIIQHLTTGSRFQYVFFQLEALQRLSSARLIREALRNLPLGLDATYDRLLLSLDAAFRSQIISCLKWLAFSNRTLHLEELAEIFILRPESALPLDESDRLFRPDDVLKYLSSLVVVQTIPPYGTYVRLAHFSVKEYLVSSRIREGPAKGFALNEVDAHLHIAHCCLAYHLQPGAMADRDQIGFRLSKYAAVEWPLHLEMVPRASWPAEVIQAAIQALAVLKSGSDNLERELRYDSKHMLSNDAYCDLPQMRVPPPCYTARYGFLQLTDMLLSQETGVSDDTTQQDLDAAFHNAAFGGHMAIVRLCLDKGADVNSKSKLYGDALQAAAFRGHVAIVSLLLDCHADANAQRGRWGSALQAAAEGGQLDVLKLLVSRGADIDLPSNESGCVLASAVRCELCSSPTRCLVYLLDAGADINRRGSGDHGTALYEAADRLPLSREHFRILLERGADVNAPGGEFGFPLQAACLRLGLAEAEVKLLLDAGAEVNAQGGRGGNALQAACATGSIETVRMLLNRGAKVDAQGGHFGRLLKFACAGRQPYTDISMLLLEHDADGNSQGGFFGSAWHAAVGKLVGKYTQGLKQLLDLGVDVDDARGKERPSALQPPVEQAARLDEILFSTASEAVKLRGRMRLFIDHGADVNQAAGKFGFLLQPACEIKARRSLDPIKQTCHLSPGRQRRPRSQEARRTPWIGSAGSDEDGKHPPDGESAARGSRCPCTRGRECGSLLNAVFIKRRYDSQAGAFVPRADHVSIPDTYRPLRGWGQMAYRLPSYQVPTAIPSYIMTRGYRKAVYSRDLRLASRQDGGREGGVGCLALGIQEWLA